MDQIFINDLLVRGVIGVTSAEREHPQDILINLVVFTDTRKAGESDHLDDTISYSVVSKHVYALVEKAGRHLVEALAADICREVMAMPGVRGVRVRVEKPGAVRFTRSVGVEIERFQEPEADSNWPIG